MKVSYFAPSPSVAGGVVQGSATDKTKKAAQVSTGTKQSPTVPTTNRDTFERTRSSAFEQLIGPNSLGQRPIPAARSEIPSGPFVNMDGQGRPEPAPHDGFGDWLKPRRGEDLKPYLNRLRDTLNELINMREAILDGVGPAAEGGDIQDHLAAVESMIRETRGMLGLNGENAESMWNGYNLTEESLGGYGPDPEPHHSGRRRRTDPTGHGAEPPGGPSEIKSRPQSAPGQPSRSHTGGGGPARQKEKGGSDDPSGSQDKSWASGGSRTEGHHNESQTPSTNDSDDTNHGSGDGGEKEPYIDTTDSNTGQSITAGPGEAPGESSSVPEHDYYLPGDDPVTGGGDRGGHDVRGQVPKGSPDNRAHWDRIEHPDVVAVGTKSGSGDEQRVDPGGAGQTNHGSRNADDLGDDLPGRIQSKGGEAGALRDTLLAYLRRLDPGDPNPAD